jgi:Ca-activated chloride channel homolog
MQISARSGAILGLCFLLATSVLPETRFRDKPLRSESDLVLVGATVVDRTDHFVSNLKKDDFRLFERKSEQSIKTFSVEETPLSVGIVFDASGSMRAALPLAQQALRAFMQAANPADEFCVVSVRSRPELSLRFVSNAENVLSHLAGATSGGQTALLDAVYLAAGYVKNGRNPRKMLLVISDGEDNNSRYTEEEVLALLRETDSTLYSIGTGIRLPEFSPDERTQAGDSLLTELAESTGGRYFQADHPRDLPDIINRIDIRYQYVIGFSPKPLQHDGKYHPIELKLAKGVRRHLRAFCRPGYKAPRD